MECIVRIFKPIIELVLFEPSRSIVTLDVSLGHIIDVVVVAGVVLFNLVEEIIHNRLIS